MKSPFKFLDSYTKDDRSIFFGRDNEIEELYQKIFESRVLLVYGVSGTGKSSLINCGLANKFRETDWLPLLVRRGSNVIDSLASVVKAASITALEGQILTPGQFLKVISSLYLDYYKPVYFIFDQFEEIFLFGDKEERKDFIQIIKLLVESDLQCRMIFVMREEYMAGVTEFEKYIPTFFDNRVRIEKMSHTNAIEAINGPCKAFNINLEEGFADALLEKLSPESTDVELTYLQVFLDKIFHLLTGSVPPPGRELKEELSFTLSLLEKTGNVSDLLGSFLEEQLSLFPDPKTALVVLKSLVSFKGTRKQMTKEEIKDYAYTLGNQILDTTLLEMLQTFIHLRILMDKDQDDRYELRHDALATKIHEKFSLVEKEILEIQQFIENAYDIWQKRQVLISAADLEYIAPYENKLFLSNSLKQFIETSKKEIDRIKKRNRNVMITWLAAVFIVLSAFSVWALRERKKAETLKFTAIEKKNESNSNLYASYSFIQLDNNPTLSFRLAEKALEVDKGNISALKAVLNSYYSTPFYSITAEYENDLNCIFLTPQENFIITVPFRSDNINIWDTKGKRIFDFISNNLSVSNIAFHPNQDIIATSGQDGALGIFDFEGNQIARLSVNEDEYISSVFSNDGRIIATIDSKALKLFDLNGTLLKSLPGNGSLPASIAMTSDNKYIVCGYYEKIEIWDLTKNTGKTFIGHKKSIVSVTISSDNKFILSSAINNNKYYSSDSTAILWNMKGEEIRTFKPGNKISFTTFSPVTNNITIGSLNGNINIFNRGGELVNFIQTHQNGIDQIQFTKDEEKIYTVSSESKNILLWNLKSKIPAKIEGHKSKISSIEYSPDGRYIVTSSYDSTAVLWSFEGKKLKVLKGHRDIVNSAQFSTDSRFVITSSNDHTAIVWDLNGEKVMNYKFDDYPVEFASFSPDNTKMVLISPANIFRIIDYKGNVLHEIRWKVDYSWNLGEASWWPRKVLLDSLGREIKYDTWHQSYVNSAGFSRDRRFVITASDDSTAKIWDLKGNKIQSLGGHNNKVIDASFSADGEKIITATLDNTLRIWNSKGQLLNVITGPKESLRYAIFSDDGKYILTQSLQDTCRLYDLKGNHLERMKWELIYISSAYFSPDGKKVLVTSRWGPTKLFNLETNALIDLEESTYASFSPDGKSIASVSNWDNIYLWDYFGNKLQTFPAQDKQVNSIKFSSDGKFILTSCDDNTARLWDLNGNEIHSFYGTGEKVTYASFAPDGKHIAIANDDCSFQIWLIDPYEIVRIVNENPDSKNVLKLNIETKKKYNIDLSNFEKIIEDARLNLLNARLENDTTQIIKYFVKAIDKYEYVLKYATDSLPRNEFIKVKNEVSNVYKELAIISIYKRDFKDALEYIQLGLSANPANGILPVYKAISLLFDNQFDKTKEIILKLKGKPFKTGDEHYDVVILNTINNLENKDIKHNDLLKLRLLIKN